MSVGILLLLSRDINHFTPKQDNKGTIEKWFAQGFTHLLHLFSISCHSILVIYGFLFIRTFSNGKEGKEK